jgi:hypothetical protein
MLHICRDVFLLLRQLRGAAGNDLGTTTKYLRQTTSAAVGIGLGTKAKYVRRTTSAAEGNGLGTTLNHLRGAVSNDRTLRSSISDAKRASVAGSGRAAAWTPR